VFSGSLVLVLIAVWYHVVGPHASPWFVSEADVIALVQRKCWVTYDPRSSDPLAGYIPTPDSMQTDLLQIKKAGFTGVVTFSSYEPFDMIPHYANRIGLEVIMGVWDPTDRREALLSASAKKYVDGYAVGHNGLGASYTYSELVKRIRWLRLRTRRPVTTTERMGKYLHDSRLLTVGDWVFPDVHLSLRDTTQTLPVPIFRADAKRNVKETFGYARQIAVLARQHRRPVLLKMVTYPMNGITDACLIEQADYFSLLLDSRRDATANVPLDVAVSVHSAFDTPWKKAWPFYQWDPYTGLLDVNGHPRPAAAVVIERLL
jgi:exo-beta-1,3-glucanase (GH17 family)